ncbi:unnamed protein product [Caenorhabditis auriculariae]|uniref:G-protein coupled receptors family 1 profile domain-containing protein n=1 Tax=Caenorhabditis auriculariae TaxID=2777116 RepID=A0A8S1H9N5_9PELO|nr:unnamed protein product [Caenorhabditis auriculariae]
MRELYNCSYRYSDQDIFTSIALWIDGPFTLVAAVLSFVGAHFAVKFLRTAGLNRELTAALFTLCAVDSLLMVSVVLKQSIEATAVLFFNYNIMFDKQALMLIMHALTISFTTCSTLLVVYISFLRFLVVFRPMKFVSSTMGSVRYKSGSPMNQSFDRPLTRQCSRASMRLSLRKLIRPYYLPGAVVVCSFIINIPLYFEFTMVECFDVLHQVVASNPAPTEFRNTFARYKAILMTLTQTIGPVGMIFFLSVVTEYHVHASLIARKKLFESQRRRQSLLQTEELKERISRTVGIIIAVKFLILRSMPVFFDVYENLYGIESFGLVLSVMVRVSDFLVVLNSATNSLATFGKNIWFERRLRFKLLKHARIEKDMEKNAYKAMKATSAMAVMGVPPKCCLVDLPSSKFPNPNIKTPPVDFL